MQNLQKSGTPPIAVEADFDRFIDSRRTLLNDRRRTAGPLPGCPRRRQAHHPHPPPNLPDSMTAEALQAICDLDLNDLQPVIPPRGLGRD